MKMVKVSFIFCLVLLVLGFAVSLSAQTETASLSGRVTDPHGAVVPHAVIEAIENNTNLKTTTETNNDGLFYLPSLHPGTYRVIVSKEGFKQVIQADVVLHVQDVLTLNFSLQLGSVNETVTVTGGAPLINTESAAVSTVVDRNFAENLPMNGRSFQTLVQLTPGVVLTTNTAFEGGQFSVNGQRSNSNYWMVDGVSANVGVPATAFPAGGAGGSVFAFSAQGGTNSLVSVDAMQEFRIQTSTYAPEFGRTPGAQISIVTRSGTNQFHGTLFDYFRNDALDATNWFNGTVSPPLPKAKERQNDFGGTFSGPLIKSRTFFFFSYEGLRLRLPQTTLATVPNLNARQNALPAVQPYLNAYPKPNGTDNLANGVAQFNASYSNSSSLDAYSLRIDHKLNDKLSIFGRYNYSPSDLVTRGSQQFNSLSSVSPARIVIQTGTVGLTWSVRPTMLNDLRFNYSRANSNSSSFLDSFGGAVPVPSASLALPPSFTAQNANFNFGILALANPVLSAGRIIRNVQRQINLLDSVSMQKGPHSIKFGLDFRRLSPTDDTAALQQFDFFLTVPSAQNGALLSIVLNSAIPASLVLHNVGVFAQDTWRASSRLTLTYGLRWDLDFEPESASGPSLPAVTGFSLSNFSNLALAPSGTPIFTTTYGNVAPRFGIAYRLSESQRWQTVLRGGAGLFYDLATQEMGELLRGYYPFGANSFKLGGTFPNASSTAVPPPIAPPDLVNGGSLPAFDPHLALPYTVEWNVAVEQALGAKQVISASYVAATGRRLLQEGAVSKPNAKLASAELFVNTATSDYHALQLKFERRLSNGLQALASYTWSHSIDEGSAGSIGQVSNVFAPAVNSKVNRGPSDFDIRNAFSAGMTYDISTTRISRFTSAVLGGWSFQNVIQVRSAPPVDVDYQFRYKIGGATAGVRPDLVSGIPLYLHGAQYPGGKIFNNTPNQGGPGCIGPFCPPPLGSDGQPLRQGNLSRNTFRGFGAAQWDVGVHRDFPIHEAVKLQFRAELFNVLNHPNFGQPVGNLTSSQFGRSTQTLGSSLNTGPGAGGGFSALYQIGGPRSIQLALKMFF